MTGFTDYEIVTMLPSLEGAACKDFEDPDLFFSPNYEDSETFNTLRSICGSCPVQKECLAYALEHRMKDGFWGGLTAKQRKSLLRGKAKSKGTPGRKSGRVDLIRTMRADGKSYAQIATALGITEESAIQSMVRYRKKLRSQS